MSEENICVSGASDNRPDWLYPEWAASAPYNKAIVVRDTNTALGRCNLKTEEIGLKDLSRKFNPAC